MHKARGRRGVAAVRELWTARDELAERRDVTPGRILPDSAIVAAANAMPADRAALLGTRGFHGRGAERYSETWLRPIETARTMPEAELPPLSRTLLRSPAAAVLGRTQPRGRRPAGDGPPGAGRAVGGASTCRWRTCSPPTSCAVCSGSHPPTRDPVQLPDAVADALDEMGARPWQRDLVGPLLVSAILDPTPPAAPAESDDPQA